MSAKEDKTLLDSDQDDYDYDDDEEGEEENLAVTWHSISLEDNVFGSFVHKMATPKRTLLGCSQLALASLLVFATFYIQTAFVWAMIPAISKDELIGKHNSVGFKLDAADMCPKKQNNLFAEWRCNRKDGADVSFDGKTPRAQYACNGKEWSFQEAQLDNWVKYTGLVKSALMMFLGDGAPRGAIFGVLALILWSATIVQALRKAGEFGTLILAESETSTAFPQSVGLKLTVAIVALFRVFVVVSLGFYGGKFLSHTDNLKDFILNSVALGFVIDIPDLFFNAFASAVEKVEMAEYGDKAQLKTWVPGIIWNHSGILSLLTALALFVFNFVNFLVPFANNMTEFVTGTACFEPKNNAFAA